MHLASLLLVQQHKPQPGAGLGLRSGRAPTFLLIAAWIGVRGGRVKESIVLSEKLIAEQVERLVEPAINAMGYELVRVHLTGGRNKRVLQIMAEPHKAETMTVDDCAQISRTVSALLDVEDLIPGEYTLEVSSPGIDRPLVKRKDFERYAGYEIKLEASRTIDGRRRFRGRLKGLIDDRVCIEVDNGQTEISFADITKAKLVLTDDLLARQSSG